MFWIAIVILTICSFILPAQSPDRDVIIFWDGTKVFGYRQPTNHPDIVLIKDEDGVILSFNRNAIKSIMKERDLNRSRFAPIAPEFNFSLYGGTAVSRGYGHSAGFKAGYVVRGGVFVGVTALRNFGKTEYMHVTLFEEIRDENGRLVNYVQHRVPVNETTQSILNAVHIELVRSVYAIRFRPFFSLGIARLENSIEYLDGDPGNPDYRGFSGKPREGSKSILHMPVGIAGEYPAFRNILLGMEFRYSIAKNIQDPDNYIFGSYRSFLDRANNSFPVHVMFGFRL